MKKQLKLFVFLSVMTTHLAIATEAVATERMPFEPEMVQIESGTFQMDSWVYIQGYQRSARRDRIMQSHQPQRVHGLGFRVARTL